MNIRAKVIRGVADEPSSRRRSRRARRPIPSTASWFLARSAAPVTARGEDRHRLTEERARITHNGADHEVELINLSGGGAMIAAGDIELSLWDHLNLHLGNHGDDRMCRPLDQRRRVGLEFAHETRLDWPSDQVATVLRHVIEKTFPHISFPEKEGTPPPPRLNGPTTIAMRRVTRSSGTASCITIIRATTSGSATSPRPAR